MSSGYYPISKLETKPYELLKQAIKNIEYVRDYIGISEYECDNAANDGASDFRLGLAIQLIDECIK